MTIYLHAQPYNISAAGFYFDTYDDYTEKRADCIDPFGGPIEEFEIQFIDGEDIDCVLFKAWDVHQSNLEAFLDAIETLEDFEKIALIALGECGYILDENPPVNDVDIYYCENLKVLAMQFVDEGLYGTIPESIIHYLDYEAMARDLGMEYTETQIAGQSLIYRCP